MKGKRKKRVLIIHPVIEGNGLIYYFIMPMGLFSIADQLDKAGFEVRILNIGIEKIKDKNFSIKKYIRYFSPDYVGIDLHWYQYIFPALEIAKICKEEGAKVTLGGITATLFAEEIIRDYDFVDFVIKGDGELPFRFLVEGKPIEEIPNVVYRKDGKVITSPLRWYADIREINEFNFLRIDLMEHADEYLKKIPSSFVSYVNSRNKPKSMFFLFVGRGCSSLCSYCGGNLLFHKKISGRAKIALRSADNVARDIKTLYRMGVDTIYLEFEPYNLSDFYCEVMEILRKSKINNIGIYFGSWNLPDEKLLKIMSSVSDPDVSWVAISPESGSENIRFKNTNKHFTNEELYKVLKLCYNLKLNVSLHWAIGFPFETYKDVQKTFDVAEHIRKIFPYIQTISVIPIEPGSPMWLNPTYYRVRLYRRNFKDFYEYSKMLSLGKYPEHPIGYETENFSEKDLITLKLKAYREFYLNPRYIANRVKGTDMKTILMKGIVAFSLIFNNHKILWKIEKI